MRPSMASIGARALLLAALWVGVASAEPLNQTLLTVPGRGELRLDGPVRVAGMSPLRLEEPLRGNFILTANKPGYVEQQARLYFPDGGGPAELKGSSPVNSVGGVIRTLALPGVGQWTEGRRGQGLTLLGTEMFAVAMLLKSDGDLSHAERQVSIVTDELNSGDPATRSPQDQVNLIVSQQRWADEVTDARHARTRWAIMAAATWGYAVLDQAFLRGGLEVQPHGFDTLRVMLAPVSRFQAVARSLFIPGTGQAYAGHIGRGTLFLLGAAAATGAALAAEAHFDRTLSVQTEAQLRYDQLFAITGDVSQLSAARDAVQGAYGEARDARKLRNILWAGAGAVWALNVFDALAMDIPGETGGLTAGLPSTGLYTSIHPGSFRLGIHRGF